MPRVKIDYIVSFSSEDPGNQASNLLAWEVSKKKWLCGRGEASCSVVLQLTRAVKISAVHIGAYNAAFVEVLVGRSEKPNEDYQVLVPKSMFLSPAESRRAVAGAAERVRSFSGEQGQLLAPARDQRWDRVRLVCSQPHTKHSAFGLSFLHLYSADGGLTPPAPALALEPALDTLSSDEDDFKPGELFAKHLSTADQRSNNDTGFQIRQATSQALKNISDSATKLMKTPIAKTGSKHEKRADERTEDRTRSGLLYTDDDSRPHDKIDRVVQRHNNQKTNKSSDKKEKLHDTVTGHKDDSRDSTKKNNNDRRNDNNRDSIRDEDPNRMKVLNAEKTRVSVAHDNGKRKHNENGLSGAHSSNTDTAGDQGVENESRKRPRSDTEREIKGGAGDAGGAGGAGGGPLHGVRLVLSGYQNPRRAALRHAALALGARVERDWGAGCTHLVCAFPNTPKLRQVRGAPGGESVPAARGEWLERCAAARRRLPWRAFATEPRHRRAPPQGADDDHRLRPEAEPDCDTDEEIEKVLRDRKKRKADDSPQRSRNASPDPLFPPCPAESDRASPNRKINSRPTDTNADSTSRSNRYSMDTMIMDCDAVADVTATQGSTERSGDELPNFFDGYTFVIDERAMDERFDVRLLNRYVRAYGGVVLEVSQLDEESEVNYVLCTMSSTVRAAAAVRPDWVWRCHGARTLLPTKEFALP